MTITVRLPAIVRPPEMPVDYRIDAAVATIGDLMAALDARFPGLARELDDSLYNVAVNDALLLRGVRQHPLRDGDVVEIVPAIAGG